VIAREKDVSLQGWRLKDGDSRTGMETCPSVSISLLESPSLSLHPCP
jgi:hypothetical protein